MEDLQWNLLNEWINDRLNAFSKSHLGEGLSKSIFSELGKQTREIKCDFNFNLTLKP